MLFRSSSFVVLLALAMPQGAAAQGSDAIPVVSNERPMRFVLSSGTVVIGSRAGEDAEYWTVQTQGGLVRVRKTDVSYMDFRTNESAPAPVVAAPVVTPAPPAPPPQLPRRGRRALLTAGIASLAVSYGLTGVVGAIVSIWDADANWMFVPVGGPMIYYRVGNLDRDVFGLLLLSTIFQGAGLVAMILGIVLYTSGREEEAVGGASRAPRLAVNPMVGPDLRGLLVSLRL